MAEVKATRIVAVSNAEGIHARAATLIAELVRRFDSQVAVIKDRERVESTDVLQVLSLGASQGEQLSLEAVGHDAEEVLDALVELFAANFEDKRGE